MRLAIGFCGLLTTNLVGAQEEPPYNPSTPAISPDGKWVAFYSSRAGNHNEYLLELATGEVRQLTDSTLEEFGPAWSPDSKTVYFYGGNDGEFEVYRIGIEPGATREKVTELGGYVGNPDISPDGDLMLISWNQGSSDNDYEIFAFDLGSSVLTQLTDNENQDFTPTWSPDGASIAFNSDRKADQFDVWVMDSDGGSPRQLANLRPHDYYTSWSPDGAWVAFFSGVDFDHFDAYKVNVGTGEVVRLTEGLGTGKVSFSSDGSFIVFWADHSDGAGLYRARPDGSKMELLLR